MIRALRLAAGVCFLTAFVGKALDSDTTRRSAILFSRSEATLRAAGDMVEGALPAWEAIAGAGLVAGVGVRAASALGLALGILFAVAGAAVHAQGASCRCFGVLGGFTALWLHEAVAVSVALACAVVLRAACRSAVAQPPARDRRA